MIKKSHAVRSPHKLHRARNGGTCTPCVAFLSRAEAVVLSVAADQAGRSHHAVFGMPDRYFTEYHRAGHPSSGTSHPPQDEDASFIRELASKIDQELGMPHRQRDIPMALWHPPTLSGGDWFFCAQCHHA